MVKDTSISRLPENHRKFGMSENSKVVYDFQQNELHDGHAVLV